MKIGIMLRAYDKAGGIGIYSRNIVKQLLKYDRNNYYVLFYNNLSNVGQFNHYGNVKEIYIPPVNPVLWDQFLIPPQILRHKIDLIFNTKFSVPLLTRAKRIMVLHGASWFVHPELYGRFDIFYVNRAIPIYCKLSDLLISNSDLTTNDYIRLFHLPPNKVQTVHLAAGDEFRRVRNKASLAGIRSKYKLPESFILTVTSYDPRKNFGTLLQALGLTHRSHKIHLVVVGKDCDRYAHDHNLANRGIGAYIHFPGWIDQKDLPYIYSMAEVFAFPSVYEEFGIPIVEAMACGCPIVSSTTGAIPHLTSGAALLCDPFDHVCLADNILSLLNSSNISKRCRSLGLSRAEHFSWKRAAHQTLAAFQSLC